LILDNPRVRPTRVYSAGVVLGVTFAAAVWLYTYRTSSVFEYIDRNGHRFHASERVHVQPWWSVPATLSVLFVGLGINLWLLSEGRRLLARFSAHFGRRDSEFG
jgi:hypothetical protein